MMSLTEFATENTEDTETRQTFYSRSLILDCLTFQIRPAPSLA